jgi:hypothetical protein
MNCLHLNLREEMMMEVMALLHCCYCPVMTIAVPLMKTLSLTVGSVRKIIIIIIIIIGVT